MGNIGPFDLRHVIICAAIIIASAVAMFFLKDILSFGFVFPVWMMIIAIITTVAIMALFIMTLTGYLRYGKEGFLFAKARKTGTPVYIDVELGSDVGDFVLAEKSNPKDVVLKDEESGVKIDPSMLSSSAKPIRCPGGLDILIYSYYNFMPQTVGNHAGFAAIKNYFDTKCGELGFLSIKEFVELISDPEHFLERNSLIKLNKYFKVTEKKQVVKKLVDDGTGNFIEQEVLETVKIRNELGVEIPKYTYVRQFQVFEDVLDDEGNIVGKHEKWIEQDLDLPKMVQLIAQARRDISVMPIMGGLLAGTEAFKYNSVAYSSQHLGHVLMLYYTKMMDEMKGKIELLQYGIVALMILVGGGVAVYLIGMGLGGGK